MAEMVQAWKASDGSIHHTEAEAKDREFHVALADWFETFDWLKQDYLSVENLRGALFAERHKLAPIFKLVGGAGGETRSYVPTQSHNNKDQAIVR